MYVHVQTKMKSCVTTVQNILPQNAWKFLQWNFALFCCDITEYYQNAKFKGESLVHFAMQTWQTFAEKGKKDFIPSSTVSFMKK